MRLGLVGLLLAISASPVIAGDVYSREHYLTESGDEATPLRGSIHRDWNGFYIGLNTGWHFGRDHEVDQTGLGAPTGFDKTFNPAGAGLGLHFGYGWHVNSVVYGLEVDAEKTFIGGSLSSGVLGRTDAWSGFQSGLRGRVGYAFDQFMLYGTAGVAVMMSTYRDRGQIGVEGYSRALAGWTVGVGGEWAFTPNWAARLEYRYTDFGVTTLRSTVAFPGNNEKHYVVDQALRAGVTYRFNGY